MGTTKGSISKYRDRLDKTLSSPDLTNDKSLKSLLRKHLASTAINGFKECSEALLERRTSEVSNFLDMLRSTSAKSDESRGGERSHPEWKLKQDNEEYRVMYREGPPGTPYHTMLVEGYVEGTIDACLCVSWETNLFKKWWPQYNVPPFKIISSESLHKMRVGEQISLVRVKVSWPLSAREALVHFFEFEYIQDDLTIVILNTINESENISWSTHGYSRDMIPQAKDVVRIGTVGGYAIQKVNSSRSYFRTIANMDLKLDFVPPSLINFISRQLIGSGFRLYQKAIASVFNSDDDFKKALEDPLYTRIRDAFYNTNEQNQKLEDKVTRNEVGDNVQTAHLLEDVEEEISKEIRTIEVVQDSMEEKNHKIFVDDEVGETAPHGTTAQSRTTNCEIEEEITVLTEASRREESRSRDTNKRKVRICPEVEQALRTLDKVIAIVREQGWNTYNRSATEDEEVVPTPPGRQTSIWDPVDSNVSKDDTGERHSNERWNSSNTHSLRSKQSNSKKEVNHKKVTPASPMQNLVAPGQTDQVTLFSSEKGKTEQLEYVSREGIKEKNISGKKSRDSRRNYKLCCFHPSSRQSFG